MTMVLITKKDSFLQCSISSSGPLHRKDGMLCCFPLRVYTWCIRTKSRRKVSLSLDIFFVAISRRKVLLFGFTRVFLTKSRRKIFAVVVTLTHGVFLHWFIRENLWFFIVMVVLVPPAAYHNSWLWVFAVLPLSLYF
jgi:hypothetical protein